MYSRNLTRPAWRAGVAIAASLLAAGLALAREPDRGVLVLTSTNDPARMAPGGVPGMQHA